VVILYNGHYTRTLKKTLAILNHEEEIVREFRDLVYPEKGGTFD
jgi:hypothetical protein